MYSHTVPSIDHEAGEQCSMARPKGEIAQNPHESSARPYCHCHHSGSPGHWDGTQGRCQRSRGADCTHRFCSDRCDLVHMSAPARLHGVSSDANFSTLPHVT